MYPRLLSSLIVSRSSSVPLSIHKHRSEALLKAVKKACQTWRVQAMWQQLIKKAMQKNLSWRKSGHQYVELYQKALSTTRSRL